MIGNRNPPNSGLNKIGIYRATGWPLPGRTVYIVVLEEPLWCQHPRGLIFLSYEKSEEDRPELDMPPHHKESRFCLDFHSTIFMLISTRWLRGLQLSHPWSRQKEGRKTKSKRTDLPGTAPFKLLFWNLEVHLVTSIHTPLAITMLNHPSYLGGESEV